MCSWDEIDTSESEEDSNKDKESLNCFTDLSDEVTKLNSNLDSSTDQFDMPLYDELPHAFNELHNDVNLSLHGLRHSN